MADLLDHPRPEKPYRGLFITFGSFSLANRHLVTALKNVRGDIDFDMLDISVVLRRSPVRLARVMAGTLGEYGLGALGGKSILRYRVLRSCAFFDAAHQFVADAVATGRYDFTLQTQSLFDAATPGIPNYVYTDHVATARVEQSADPDTPRREPSKAWLDLERQIYGNAAHVFVCGSSIRDRLIRDYGLVPSRVSAVGAGALPADDPDTSPERYTSQRILFVGIEWERKGGPELVQAFRQVRARLPGTRLTVIGCAPPLDEPGVEAIGRVPRHDLDQHYRESACFCMPSRLEPFGIVYAEAMKHGRPVIACRVGDVADIVAHGETGLLVPPGDVPALAAALEAVLSDPARAREMGLAGQVRAARFDWAVIARKIAAALPGASPTPVLSVVPKSEKAVS